MKKKRSKGELIALACIKCEAVEKKIARLERYKAMLTRIIYSTNDFTPTALQGVRKKVLKRVSKK